MAKKAVRYAVIDAFTDVPFKGNPAAICLLEEGDVADEQWMQSVAKEFSISQTAFLRRAIETSADLPYLNPRFHLRWFTPVAEVDLCGHATLAAAHLLFASSSANCDVIDFVTKSGLLTAKKVNNFKHQGISNGTNGKFSIELDFPMVQVIECNAEEIPSIPETLNGLSMVSVQKTGAGDLIVELASAKDVGDVQPNFEELEKCAGRGVIITVPAPPESGFDFFSRFFCPKLGINEDPVCGSAHCALAPYWSKKLGKSSLIAYMASPRGGRLDLQLEEETQRVKIQGEAVIVMEGSLLPIHNFDLPAARCGEEKATGQFTKTVSDELGTEEPNEEASCPTPTNHPINDQRDSVSSGMPPSPPVSAACTENSTDMSESSGSQRSREARDELFVSAIRKIGDAIMSGNLGGSDRLHGAVMEVDGYGEEDLDRAFDYLMHHPVEGRGFMVKSMNHRKAWLRRFFDGDL